MWICTMVRPVWFSCTSGNVFVGILFMTELKTIESFTLRMALPENVSDAQMLEDLDPLLRDLSNEFALEAMLHLSCSELLALSLLTRTSRRKLDNRLREP